MVAQTSCLIVYFVVMLSGRFLSQRQRRNRKSLSSQWRDIVNDPTAVLSGLSMAIAISVALIGTILRQSTVLQIDTALAGVAILVVGWSIAYFANREIGKNWSPTIEKTQKQKLVISGIYGVVRHPLYLSGLLILIGTNVYFGSEWAWLGAILALIVTLLRIPIEEKHLKERFGEKYTDYKWRTKAILPCIL